MKYTLTIIYFLFSQAQNETDEIRKSVSDALMILEVFEDPNDKKIELERISKIVKVIDSVIMQGYFLVIKPRRHRDNFLA